jgi:hypothetical protein
MRRRDFIAGLGSAAAWPLEAWSRQSERVRRNRRADGFVCQWADGRHVRIDIRWANNVELMRTAGSMSGNGATVEPLRGLASLHIPTHVRAGCSVKFGLAAGALAAAGATGLGAPLAGVLEQRLLRALNLFATLRYQQDSPHPTDAASRLGRRP